MTESVCLFGDSIVKGVVFDNLRNRYSLLKNSFAELFGKWSGLAVKNYAKFGCTITTGRQIIERHAMELSGYRFVALEFGGNDCDFDWAAVSDRPDDIHLPKTPISEFETHYEGIIDSVKAAGGNPVLMSLPPLDASRYFSFITRGLNAENILKWLGDVDRIYRWHELYNLAVLKLAATKNVPLIDIRRAFLETRDYTKMYCEDGIHPNEAGHSLISEVAKGFMARIG